ncbi:MAG: methyltransferase [Candidatus Binatota bacterium]
MRICKGKTKHSGSARQETLDTLFQGRLKVVQRKGGYRFSIDTLLLAHFVKVQGREKIVDLGAGNGVIPLMLAFLYPAVRVVGLEIQEEMVQRALRSVSLNRLRERVEIL